MRKIYGRLAELGRTAGEDPEGKTRGGRRAAEMANGGCTDLPTALPPGTIRDTAVAGGACPDLAGLSPTWRLCEGVGQPRERARKRGLGGRRGERLVRRD